jgi:peptidoglycan/LPS O-acetylase OafA/YrhL
MIPVVNHSLKYNPSLDGLRGIAVSIVILFHIWPAYFPFGYLGVDLFFILSGYLITQIIYVKLEKNKFSFKKFYRNRIRRIFPAVIIVLSFVMLTGYLFLFPSEFESIGKHIKSSAFFYQNFRLIDEVDYWNEAAQLKPLLHFWSLSIEEQFYLFWPLFIFAIYRLKLNLFASLSVLFIISFSLPYLFEIDRFYHSLARFWELILGGLIYAISLKYTIPISKNNKFLSFYPLIFLGLISFPLYLWHYAIISYIHIFGLNVQNYALIIILSSVILAYFTYRYVEFYARQKSNYLFVFMLFVVLFLIGLLGKYIYKDNGLENRNHLVSNLEFKQQFIRTPAQNNNGILLVTKILGYTPSNDYIKATVNDLSKKYILVIGDSHAHTSYPGFAQEFKKKGYETLLLANSSCPPYSGGAMGKNIKVVNECKQKIKSQYEMIEKISNLNKILFIARGPAYMYGIGFGVVDGGDKKPYSGSNFENYFTDKNNWNQKKQFFKGIENLFYKFNNNKKLYFLLENPELGFSPKNCMTRPFDIFPSNCRISLNKYLKRAGEYRKVVKKLAIKYKNITLLDPKKLYCDEEYCYAIKDGKILYADDDHHSIDGSITQAKYFIDKIFNAK